MLRCALCPLHAMPAQHFIVAERALHSLCLHARLLPLDSSTPAPCKARPMVRTAGACVLGFCPTVCELGACLAQVVPVFAGGLDFSLPVRKYFYDPLGSGKAFVDCVVSLTGFALVGGPARQDAPKVGLGPASPSDNTCSPGLLSPASRLWGSAVSCLSHPCHRLRRIAFGEMPKAY